MKRILVAALAALALTGCQTERPTYIKTQYMVVQVPESMYKGCPELKSFPDPDKLTDGQVSALLIKLAANNKQCANTLVAIKKYLADSKVQVEQLNQDNLQ